MSINCSKLLSTFESETFIKPAPLNPILVKPLLSIKDYYKATRIFIICYILNESLLPFFQASRKNYYRFFNRFRAVHARQYASLDTRDFLSLLHKNSHRFSSPYEIPKEAWFLKHTSDNGNGERIFRYDGILIMLLL